METYTEDGALRCSEYAGRPTPTGQRRQCERTATREAYHLGEWKALCQYHVREYFDLPQRTVGSPAR